jgi:hypothetical protein
MDASGLQQQPLSGAYARLMAAAAAAEATALAVQLRLFDAAPAEGDGRSWSPDELAGAWRLGSRTAPPRVTQVASVSRTRAQLAAARRRRSGLALT